MTVNNWPIIISSSRGKHLASKPYSLHLAKPFNLKCETIHTFHHLTKNTKIGLEHKNVTFVRSTFIQNFKFLRNHNLTPSQPEDATLNQKHVNSPWSSISLSRWIGLRLLLLTTSYRWHKNMERCTMHSSQQAKNYLDHINTTNPCPTKIPEKDFFSR